MSWRITPGWAPADADAAAYITAVEAADGQALEERTKIAIDDFVLGCKADGIWSAIKASCILAGARTLAGALVPLAGAAPTNFNFVSGDYNRKTGLVGNGTTKYLSRHRNNNADPQNSFHMACYATAVGSATAVYVGAGATTIETGISNLGRGASSVLTFARNRASAVGLAFSAAPVGLVATSRSGSTEYARRANGVQDTRSEASQLPSSFDLAVLSSSGGAFPTDARLAFYSIGESLNLTLLDARVTALINAFAAAIP
jgi:hypothetical protein